MEASTRRCSLPSYLYWRSRREQATTLQKQKKQDIWLRWVGGD